MPPAENTPPLETLIRDPLQLEGLHPDTAQLIELALIAQQTGTMPALPPEMIPPPINSPP